MNVLRHAEDVTSPSRLSLGLHLKWLRAHALANDRRLMPACKAHLGSSGIEAALSAGLLAVSSHRKAA